MVSECRKQITYQRIKGRDLFFVVHADMTVTDFCTALGISRRDRSALLSAGRLRIGSQTLTSYDGIDAGTTVLLQLDHTPPMSSPDPRGTTHSLAPGVYQPFSQAPFSHALILAIDPFFCAVNKPAGLLVHSDGTGAPTLTNLVSSYLLAHGSNAQPQALQRLDVATTGVLLFSLTHEFQPAFDELVESRDLHKYYLAVVTGTIPEDRLYIEAPLGRDRHDARRMRVSRTGKSASTRVSVLARHNNMTLVLVELLSGRRHQIRVHLSSQGHPVVGDTLYGAPASKLGLALHAWREVFNHPITGEEIKLETPWPARFSQLGFTADYASQIAMDKESGRGEGRGDELGGEAKG